MKYGKCPNCGEEKLKKQPHQLMILLNCSNCDYTYGLCPKCGGKEHKKQKHQLMTLMTCLNCDYTVRTGIYGTVGGIRIPVLSKPVLSEAEKAANKIRAIETLIRQKEAEAELKAKELKKQEKESERTRIEMAEQAERVKRIKEAEKRRDAERKR